MNGAHWESALESQEGLVFGGAKEAARVTSSRFSACEKFLFVLFLFTLPLVNPWVRGDGVGYYAYVRSLLIDHDLRFENDWLAGNASFVSARTDVAGHLLPDQYTRTGYVGNHFSVGPSILWAPAIVATHAAVLALDRLGAHIQADGYSRPYLIAMALTTALCGFAGIFLSFLIARKYFSERWALLAALGVWLASSLPVYMYFNPAWSHAHSAFAAALFIWYWERTHLRRTLAQWTILGLIAGLMVNVYYPNAFLMVFPVVEVIFSLRRSTRGWKSGESFGRIAASTALFGAVFMLALLPTFVTRQIIYGSPFETGYPSIRFWHWASPLFGSVLFSSDHGLLTWTPILALAILGLVFLWKRSVLLAGCATLSLLLFLYFIASYPDWDGLSSFGNRFFVSLTPLFVIGLAAFFETLARWIGNARRAFVAVSCGVALFAVWNAAFVFQWGTHLVPVRGPISWSEMVHNQFAVVPGRATRDLEIYLLRRKAMMQHIEEEDMQQQKAQRGQEK